MGSITQKEALALAVGDAKIKVPPSVDRYLTDGENASPEKATSIESRRVVWSWLIKYGISTVAEIAQGLGRPAHHVQNTLYGLMKTGYVERNPDPELRKRYRYKAVPR